MTSEPAAPGAPAVILYRVVLRDDTGLTAHEDNYFRIKILTDEGRKYADVEILFSKDLGNVRGIHGRTIKPDGSVVEFDGKVFTKTVVKGRGVKYLARTFTLPAVQAGCIIEYFYTIDWSEYKLVDSNWILSNELFTKAGDFALKPYMSNYEHWNVDWISQNVPLGTGQAKEGHDGVIRLHVSNIAAFPTEDFMPPENELKARVDFIYSQDPPDDNVTHFWATVGKRLNGHLESFVGKPKAFEKVVEGIVGPNDAPEVKLQKIYARMQQMRNTSYEPRKTEQEEKREKEKEAASAEEVWKRGYGNGTEITWLYLALVKAAGFEAYGMWVPDRQEYFFKPELMQSRRLNSNLVVIKLNGKDIFCDPGAAFTPFGLLPWQETDVQGLRLGGKVAVWTTSLEPTGEQAITQRKAQLALTDTGDLEGTLTVTYTGLEAASHRLEERNADETGRRTYLEDMIKGYIPAASEVKLTNQPEWKNSALPLVAEFNLKVPGGASDAGRRVLVASGIFTAHEKHVFDHEARAYPIYFEYPYMVLDDINIKVPAGWKVAGVPKGWQTAGKVINYNLGAFSANGALGMTRLLEVEFIVLPSPYYHSLRNFYQEIKTTDEQQFILEPGAARAGNP